MPVNPIPQSAINIYKLFKEILKTNERSPDGLKKLLRDVDIEWAAKVWIKNYDNFRKVPDMFYMTLVLINRKTISGKFSLIYNENIYKVIEKRKEKELIKLYSTPFFSELYDNKELSKREINECEATLRKEMLCMNFFLKKVENMKISETNFLDSPEYKECFYQIYALHDQEDVSFLRTSTLKFATVTEYNEHTDSYQIMTFDILNLLSLICYDENNTYTNKPFNEKTVNYYKENFPIEMKMIKRSYGKK